MTTHAPTLPWNRAAAFLEMAGWARGGGGDDVLVAPSGFAVIYQVQFEDRALLIGLARSLERRLSNPVVTDFTGEERARIDEANTDARSLLSAIRLAVGAFDEQDESQVA